MRIYKLHEYPEISCDFPHTEFVDDLKKLFAIYTDRDQYSLFINNHSNEYLHNLIVSYPPLLKEMLQVNPTAHRGKIRFGLAFSHYFRGLELRKRARLEREQQIDLTPNGHTEPNGPEKATRQ